MEKRIKTFRHKSSFSRVIKPFQSEQKQPRLFHYLYNDTQTKRQTNHKRCLTDLNLQDEDILPEIPLNNYPKLDNQLENKTPLLKRMYSQYKIPTGFSRYVQSQQKIQRVRRHQNPQNLNLIYNLIQHRNSNRIINLSQFEGSKQRSNSVINKRKQFVIMNKGFFLLTKKYQTQDLSKLFENNIEQFLSIFLSKPKSLRQQIYLDRLTEYFLRFPFFAKIYQNYGQKSLPSLMQSMQCLKLKKGQILHDAKEQLNCIYFCFGGVIGIFDQRRQKVRSVDSGQLVWDLQEVFPIHYAQALTDCLVLYIDQKIMMNILEQSIGQRQNEIISIIKGQAIFQGSSKMLLNRIYLSLTEVRYIKNEFVYKQGQDAHFVYFILAGSVTLLKMIKQNKKRYKIPITQLQVGCMFGQIEVVKQQPRKFTCVCSSQESILLKIQASEFLNLVCKNDELKAYLKEQSDISDKFRQNLVECKIRTLINSEHKSKYDNNSQNQLQGDYLLSLVQKYKDSSHIEKRSKSIAPQEQQKILKKPLSYNVINFRNTPNLAVTQKQIAFRKQINQGISRARNQRSPINIHILKLKQVNQKKNRSANSSPVQSATSSPHLYLFQ